MIPRSQTQSANALRVIMPYKWNGLRVFDDKTTGLVREALVAGIDEMLDMVSANIPNAEKGFVVIFSDKPFPGYKLRLRWLRPGYRKSGDWYWCYQLKKEGWLCPALLRYFKTAPRNIYANFLPRGGTTKTKTTSEHEQKK